jgi:hypothetical protein
VQGGSASVWSSGETLEEGAASRYAVLTVYSLQGIPGSGQRIDNTHLFWLGSLGPLCFSFWTENQCLRNGVALLGCFHMCVRDADEMVFNDPS